MRSYIFILSYQNTNYQIHKMIFANIINFSDSNWIISHVQQDIV